MILSAILIAALVPNGLAQVSHIDEVASSTLVSALQRGDWTAKNQCIIQEAQRVAPELTGAAIAALSNELIHLTELLLNDGHESPETYPEDFEFGEYMYAVSRILAREHSPVSINAMVGALSSTGQLNAAVRSFGDVAVPALVANARSEHGLLGHVHSALDVLEQMLESPTIAPTLSAESRASIREIAAERFANPGTVIRYRVFVSAAYLGVATGDSQLRADASALVDNPAGLAAHGLNDPADVVFYSGRLRQALAKTFPKP